LYGKKLHPIHGPVTVESQGDRLGQVNAQVHNFLQAKTRQLIAPLRKYTCLKRSVSSDTYWFYE